MNAQMRGAAHACLLSTMTGLLLAQGGNVLAQSAGRVQHADAEEVIAYKMPGFRIGQSIIAGYAAFSKQCGLYLSPSAIKSHADDIAAAGLKSTKTGVTFSPSQPIPDVLVRKLALASRRDQNL